MKEAIAPVSSIGLSTHSILPTSSTALESSIQYGYKFQPARLLLFNNPKNNRKVKSISKESLDNLLNNHVRGYMSLATRQRVKSILYAWSYAIREFNKFQEANNNQSNRRIVMITTTLSSNQIHTDKEIKKHILTRFIEDLKKLHKIDHYFWKAEAQKNGNIHFHILIDKYIDWRIIQRLWNKHQGTLGYTDRYKLKHGNKNPNSTDVHAVKADANAIRYCFNYTLKDEMKRPIDGRICGYSDSMNEIKENYIDVTPSEGKEIEALRTHKKARVIEKENYVYIDLSKLTDRELGTNAPTIFALYLSTAYQNIETLRYFDD